MKKEFRIFILLLFVAGVTFYINPMDIHAECTYSTASTVCTQKFNKSVKTDKTEIIQDAGTISIKVCEEEDVTKSKIFFYVNYKKNSSSKGASIRILETNYNGISKLGAGNRITSKDVETIYMSNPAKQAFIDSLSLDSIKNKTVDCPSKVYVDSSFSNICFANSEKYCSEVQDDVKGIAYSKLGKVPSTNTQNGTDKDAITLDVAENATCDSLFGNLNKDDGIDSPADFLFVGFDTLKYIAIIVLIAFSMMDYVKAVVAKDDDMLKKANGSFMKRLIICLIIFFLPIFIKILFAWGNVITENPLCGIGGY